MAKFKVNDRVRIIGTGEIGTVKGRDIIPIEAIMDVKADYIKNNFDKFINKSKKRETNNS